MGQDVLIYGFVLFPCDRLRYGLLRWHLQHCLTCFTGNITVVLLIAPAMCVFRLQDVSEILGTTFFVDGLVTLLQTTLGVRSVAGCVSSSIDVK